ncbi:hypothetical protein [Terricaulis silvestris]|uniref:DUF1570 domain-containing protein n=1 Tax=Terricaulis silvestris TaxID=2686094 RepID=A0A6I6MFI3_9CAUL|nr:hypothetical protein [Terricaulis silvestris]QGZ93220.1 hypothetical protein DSM104635_00026 [Terricaulis silvestris]
MTNLVRFLAASAALFLFAAPAEAQRTNWQVRGAEGLDALLLIGAASGDVMQATQYPDEIAWVRSNFSPEGLAALDALDRGLRQADGTLTGPRLVLYFSAGPFDTVDDVLASARAPAERLRPNLEPTPYWDDADWSATMALMPAVETALLELRRIGFEQRYETEWVGEINEGITRNRVAVEPHDVVPEQERLLGRTLDRTLEVLILRFCKPYGIRITGQRFITHESYPAETQLRVAAHEVFHPPFDVEDWRFVARFARLRDDPWMRAVVETHNPQFGYNSFDGIINEDSTQALDQIVSERMGFGRDPGDRWRRSDGGMHMLAAALYHAMKEDGFDRRGGRYEDWLLSAFDRGLLTPDEVRRRARAVVGAETVDRWTPAAP